jgi:hypothetical protein
MNNTPEKHLILNRSDLTKQSAHLRSADIQASHFKGPQERFWQAETAVFVEEDGTRKILKDRHGAFANTSIVPPVSHDKI